MTAIDVNGIAAKILQEANNVGGDTWTRIRKSAPLYVRGYAQALADIAEGVKEGGISPDDRQMYVDNAELLLVQGIANTSQIVLVEVQKFIDGVLSLAKGFINSKLPVPILGV